MAFASARYVYDCIMALPNHLADQFRALEFENEVEEGIADASRAAGQEPDEWKKVQRSRKSNHVDWNTVPTSHADLAKKLTAASSASGLLQHKELFASLLELTEVSTPGVGWSWGSTLTPNYGGLGGGVGTQQLSN